MSPEWLCYVDGQEYGPYTWPQLVQMAAGGNIVPASYVRRNHDSQWYTADQVPGLFGPAAPVSPKQALHPTTAPRGAGGVSASGAMKKVSAGAVVPARPAPLQAPPRDTTAAASAQTAALTPPSGMPSLPGAAAEVPRGRVAAKTKAPQPAASPQSAPAAGKPAWIPVVRDNAPVNDAAPQFPRTEEKSTAAVPSKKADKSKTLVLALCGAIAGVALIGVLAIVWKMNQKPTDKPKEVAAAPVEIPETESNPAVIAEADPTPPVVPAPTTKQGTAPVVAKGTETKPAVVKPDASAALLSTVKQWNPVERFGSVGVSKGLMCVKMDAWLAADATGKRVQVTYQASGNAGGEVQANVAPAEGAPGETPAIAAPATAGGDGGRFITSEPATHLFVQLTIENKDVKPRPYPGWNDGETAAVLVDAAGKPFSLVALSATPGVKRFTSKEIAPGESVVDTLVFAVPAGGEMVYRLALHKGAIVAKQTSAWGYEITGGGLATLAAKAQGGGPGGNAGPAPAPAPVKPMVAIPIPGVQEQPKPAPAPAEPEKPKINPNGPIPIPGLTDAPADNNKPAGPKKPEEVPNLNAPQPKKK